MELVVSRECQLQAFDKQCAFRFDEGFRLREGDRVDHPVQPHRGAFRVAAVGFRPRPVVCGHRPVADLPGVFGQDLRLRRAAPRDPRPRGRAAAGHRVGQRPHRRDDGQSDRAHLLNVRERRGSQVVIQNCMDYSSTHHNPRGVERAEKRRAAARGGNDSRSTQIQAAKEAPCWF